MDPLRLRDVAVACSLILGLCACDGEAPEVDGGRASPDASIADAAAEDAAMTDAAAVDGCVPSCEGRACGDDGCGGACGSCGGELECREGRCEPSGCAPGCVEDCPQGCFDLGACAATGGALDLHPNVHTAGVVLTADGAVIHYRPIGAATWWRAPEAASLPDGRLATSLFELAPDTAYEVRAEAAGFTACGELQTLAVEPPHTAAATVYVDAAAAAGGDGSAGAPYATVQAAVDAASPGTDVVIRPGVYREEVRVTSGGAEGAFVRLIGEPGAVIDGTDPETLAWTADGESVWWTPWTGDPRYVGRDEARLYHYLSLADLRSGTGDDAEPMPEGYFVEGGRLYVRSGSDPAGHDFQIPRRNTGIAVLADWVWIEGLEVRWLGEGEYGKGIDVVDADHVVIRDAHVHDAPTPIWIRRGASHTRIEGCEIHQSSVYDWPWAAVKGTDHENSAIAHQGGRGLIVANNAIHDVFNGVYAGSFSDDTNPDIAFDVDVYDNRIARTGDDALEPEGAAVNHRYRSNTADHLHNGLSLAPITYGPVWALRNRFTDYEQSGFKLSNGSSGRIWLLHNTCYTDRPDTNGMGVSGDFQNVVFRNNVVRGTRYALEHARADLPNDLDHDNLYTPRGAPVIKWANQRYDDLAAWCAATGYECSGVAEAPGLIDPAAGRFGLRPDSPNVDRGARLYGVNDRYEGEAPDIGYRELGAPEPPGL